MASSEWMTLEEARDFLARAVRTQGANFRYVVGVERGCYYLPHPYTLGGTRDDDLPKAKTGCLVGTALTLAGRTNEELDINGVVDEYRQHFRLTDQAAMYLRVAQRIQDEGGTWGEAHAEAESYCEILCKAERTRASSE